MAVLLVKRRLFYVYFFNLICCLYGCFGVIPKVYVFGSSVNVPFSDGGQILGDVHERQDREKAHPGLLQSVGDSDQGQKTATSARHTLVTCVHLAIKGLKIKPFLHSIYAPLCACLSTSVRMHSGQLISCSRTILF